MDFLQFRCITGSF